MYRTTILTPTRKAIIQSFKEVAQLHESEFGKPLTAEWRENLLIHFRDTCDDRAVDQHDINRWIKTHKFISEPAAFCTVRENVNAQKNVDPNPSKYSRMVPGPGSIKAPSPSVRVRGAIRTTILTPTRKAIIQSFKQIAQLHESQFGKPLPLTAEWRENLLSHFRDTYEDQAVDEHDINRWIKAHKWISEPASFCTVRENAKAQKNVDPNPSKSKYLKIKSPRIKAIASRMVPGPGSIKTLAPSVRVRGAIKPPAPSVRVRGGGIPVPGSNVIDHQPDPHASEVDSDIEIIDAEEETVIVANEEERPIQEQLAMNVFRHLLLRTGPYAVFEFLEPAIRRVYSTRGGDVETLDFERLLGTGLLTHERFMKIYHRVLRLIHDLQNMAGEGDAGPAPDGLISHLKSFIENTQLHHAAFMTGDDDFLEGLPNAIDLPDEADLDFEPNF